MRPDLYAWLVVGLLWVVAVLNYVDRQIIFSVFPLLESDLRLSSFQLGLLSSVFLWVYGLVSPVSGFLADRFGRRRVILFSLCIWSLVTWATGLSRNFTELLWARALMGISESCYIPAALALIADYHGEGTRSRATGIHQSGLYAGIALGGVAGGWLGERYGWRLPFIILGVLGVLYGPALWVLLKAPTASASNEKMSVSTRFWPNLRELLSLRCFIDMTAVFGVVSIANWVVYTWLPLYLYERFRMSLALAGFSATFYIQLASFCGILAGGWLADRWRRSSPQGRLLTQVVGLLLSGPSLFVAGTTLSHGVLVVGLVLFGLGRGFYDCNTMPVLCQVARPNLRSTGYGIFNFAGCLAGGGMAAVAGSLKPVIGLSGVFQVGGILLFLSALMLLRIPRKTAWQNAVSP